MEDRPLPLTVAEIWLYAMLRTQKPKAMRRWLRMMRDQKTAAEVIRLRGRPRDIRCLEVWTEALQHGEEMVASVLAIRKAEKQRRRRSK